MFNNFPAFRISVRLEYQHIGNINRFAYLARSLLNPLMGQAIHIREVTRRHPTRQLEGPAYQLDVPTEGIVIREGQRIDKRFKQLTNTLTRNEIICLDAVIGYIVR